MSTYTSECTVAETTTTHIFYQNNQIFAGNCDIDVNECASGPCANSAACSDSTSAIGQFFGTGPGFAGILTYTKQETLYTGSLDSVADIASQVPASVVGTAAAVAADALSLAGMSPIVSCSSGLPTGGSCSCPHFHISILRFLTQ